MQETNLEFEFLQPVLETPDLSSGFILEAFPMIGYGCKAVDV